MKQQYFLADYLNMADTHADILSKALEQVKSFMPLSPSVLTDLPKMAFLDMLTIRFSRLQNIIGSRIFPLLLDVIGEDANTFLDKLNKLEKLGYIFDTNWWMELREIRDQIESDYLEDYEAVCEHLSIVVVRTGELLDFWQELKNKIAQLQL